MIADELEGREEILQRPMMRLLEPELVVPLVVYSQSGMPDHAPGFPCGCGTLRPGVYGTQCRMGQRGGRKTNRRRCGDQGLARTGIDRHSQAS
jgi:hypothetical protein